MMVDTEELRRLAQAYPNVPEPGESGTSFIRRRREAFLDFKDAANPAAVLELLDEIERLRLALECAHAGLGMAYDAIEKQCYDEAMLHCGHHHAQAWKALLPNA